MDQLISLTVKLPVSQAIGELVKAVADKVKKGEELSSIETTILTAAVTGVMTAK